MADDYIYFKTQIMQMTGIDLSSYKETQMKRRIDSLIARKGLKGYSAFVLALKTDPVLFKEFVTYLTINVSEFYRNPDQWEYMDKEIIPYLVQTFGTNLKIWSAACSTGDEPYSLVMALSKHIPLHQIKIYATDLDEQIIEKAKLGLYSEKSVASVPKEFLTKYFHKVGDSYQISKEIKERVTFSKHNLLDSAYPKDFHYIVCRNVLIYFTEEAKDMVYRKFYSSLNKGGILFIGSTEQIVNYRTIGYGRKNSFFYEKSL
ncbi:MAG: protein-glutamate O-methyltransferase CheR [Lachnospiraceae bacterium]|nr:protein-glutamate O-methyltransferase CheR [Lachnospiraceae bacterium]MBQ8262490.1 protein-glutamate O-methyltransferase CheR [Lachnospiraceae bacterium]